MKITSLRRALLAPVALCTLTLAVGCGSGDDTSTGSGGQTGAASSGKGLSIGVQEDWSNLPIEVAKREGFFKKHGVADPELVKFTDLPAMTAAVARGQVDAGFQSPVLVQSYNESANGAKFKFFAAGVHPTMTWVTRKDSDIPPISANDWQSTVKAWKGKTVGVPALGGIVELATRYMGKQAGLDPRKDMTVVAAGVGPALGAALKAGKVDLVAGDGFAAEAIVDSGEGVGKLDFVKNEGPEIFQDTFSAAYFAPEDRIQKDGKTYAGFSQAIDEAKAFIKDPANKTKLEEIITSYIKVPPNLVEGLVKNKIQSFDADLSDRTVERTIKAYTAVGALPGSPPSVDDIVAKPSGS
jgi:NitT/TauT family transport system substrate-binding protein